MSRHPLSRALRSPWLRLAVSIAVALAWGLFLQSQLAELRRYTWQIMPLALVAGVIGGSLYFTGLGICWTLLLRTMGDAAGTVPLAAGSHIWLSTMLTRYLPGNVWHIIGRLALAGRLGVTRSQVAASATVEQLLTLLGALAVFGLSLPFWRSDAGSPGWLLLLLPAGLALLHPRVLGALLSRVAARLRRPELVWRYTFGQMIVLLGAYSLATLAAGLALCAIVGGLTPLSLDQAGFLIGAAALAWVVGYLSVLTPSGLGVREAALVAMLAQSFPLPVAIAGSLVYRLALTLGEVVAVGVSFLSVRFTQENP